MDNRDIFTILGISSGSAEEVVESAYRSLRSKLSEDRFLEGQLGNDAAQRLTELDLAYTEYKFHLNETYTTSDDSQFKKIENLIKTGDLQEAQHILDSFNERGAEWHYLQSVIFFKKNWINESKKQLEISIQLEPNNVKYKNALDKLNNKVNEANKAFKTDTTSNNTYTGTDGGIGDEAPQMGGNGCMEWCCQMALCNLALNCCCNCR